MCYRITNKQTFKSFVGVKQWDGLISNLFKILFKWFTWDVFNVTGSIIVHDSTMDYLLYADDIIISSETQGGVQQRMDLLHLNVNL